MPEHRADTATRLQTKALVAAGIVVAAATLATGIYYSQHSHIFTSATSRQPTRYTELYFSNPTSLPVRVPRGSALPVSFTVHNLEARNMQYAVAVSLIGASGQVLAGNQQQIGLASTASKSITVPVVVPAGYHGAAEAQVTLSNLHQSIHFKVRVP